MVTTRPIRLPDGPGASSSPGRLVGVDVARALALLGMMAAHVGGVAEELDVTDPSTWSAVVNGRSSTLFAVLAGVSVGLVSGRTAPPGPPAIGRVRARLAIRAAVVVAVGLALMLLGTPVYVILPTYGALFLLVLPVLRWPRWALLVLAAVCAVASAPVALALVPLYGDAGMFAVQLGLVYPVVTFLAYVLVGLAVGRTGLEARGRQVALLASGALVALAAYLVGNRSAPLPPDVGYAFPGVPWISSLGTDSVWAQVFLSPRDHSSSLVDVAGTSGVAVAVIGLCTLLFDGRGAVVSRMASPLAAIGSMPLSIYALHLVVIAALPALPDSAAAWAWFALGSAAFAMLWRRYLRRGPLERVTATLTGLVPR
jgi:uncharacterized membrane protein YeiB